MTNPTAQEPAADLARAGRRNAESMPDGDAVIEGGIRWSWADLDARAEACAAALAAAGLGAGGRVALLGRTTAPAIALLHGAARAGVAVVPLNDRLTQVELAAFLEAVDVTHVVAGNEALPLAQRLCPAPLRLSDLIATPVDEAWTALPYPAADMPAVIVATSGTTGAAKGAVLTGAALAASAAAWNEFLPPATGWLASLSPAHVGGLGIIWRAALSGVPVVVPSDARGGSADAMTPPVSHVSVVAAQLARLLDEMNGRPAPSGLRAVLLGGGPISSDLVTRALAAGWPVVPTYGMTESASGVTALATVDAGSRPGSAGRALPGVELRVVRSSGDGVGEIEVRGSILFSGYSGLPDETAAALGPGGWYRTGDLGSIDADGYLTVADRRLDLIVSGGENVYPAEVEAALLSHPAVADAGVVGRPDERWGAVPVAVVAVRGEGTVTDEELRAHCADRLAGFKLPAAIYRLPGLPRNDAGKLDRRALRDLVGDTRPGVRGPARAPLVTGTPTGSSVRSTQPIRHFSSADGMQLAYRIVDRPNREGKTRRSEPAVLLLHSTLSSGWQLKGLAWAVSAWATVVLPDRRGSGASRLSEPRSVELPMQVSDAVALLDEMGVGRALVFGHSYGGVVALALAAAHPERVDAVIAYEPPLLDVVGPTELGSAAEIATLVRSAHAAGGATAASRAFLRVIGGVDLLDGASSSTRAAVLAEGDGVLADVGALENARVALEDVVCPVVLVTGDDSEPFYRPIADAAAACLPHATRVRLPGLKHHAPITQPAAVAQLIRLELERQAGSTSDRSASARSSRPS